MNALIDTNILLRLADEKHLLHQTAVEAVEIFRQTKVLCIFPQNIYEFWVVATRPTKDNGLGYTQEEALSAIATLEEFYKLIPETPSFFTEWKSLVTGFVVNGKIGHDAHLAAGMRANGIPEILTFDDQDFHRFTGITAVNPKNVIASPRQADSNSPQEPESTQS